MKKDVKKKGIAPDDIGELPNEHRCKNCFGLLSKFEDTKGKEKLWCFKCGVASEVKV